MRLREAADVLGVHYQTAYLWVRRGSLAARKQGRDYEVDEADVRMLAAQRRQGSQPAREIGVRDWPAQADQLHTAIARGEETQARHWLARLAAGVTVLDLCERIIAPALRRIGDDWGHGAGLDRAGTQGQRHLRAADRPARRPASGPAPRVCGGDHPAR
jgi:MerR family transcriptional regulator, light-induced transcriptional regulator